MQPECTAVSPLSADQELQQLRYEQALLVDLLNVDRSQLRLFMATAARALTRVRSLLHQRAREPELYRHKLMRLHTQCARLQRHAAVLSMTKLAEMLALCAQALEAPTTNDPPSGDMMLAALAHLDEVFLALIMIAQRTGIPLAARRAKRRRRPQMQRESATALNSPAGVRLAATRQVPQLEIALQQLAERVATELGKRFTLTTFGLEFMPAESASAFYDMLSQMLRNAIEHGIESPAERNTAGKNPVGALLVEYKPHHGEQSELVFQDDGHGLNVERIVDAAVNSGLIGDDATLARDPRQASKLIFHPGLSTAADAHGRGAGMRIVRDNVKRLGGHIQVATKRGQFTRVRIRLPAAVQPAADQPVAVQA